MSPAGVREVRREGSKSTVPSLPLICCHSSGLPLLGSSFYLIVISGQPARGGRIKRDKWRWLVPSRRPQITGKYREVQLGRP